MRPGAAAKSNRQGCEERVEFGAYGPISARSSMIRASITTDLQAKVSGDVPIRSPFDFSRRFHDEAEPPAC